MKKLKRPLHPINYPIVKQIRITHDKTMFLVLIDSLTMKMLQKLSLSMAIMEELSVTSVPIISIKYIWQLLNLTKGVLR
jgi:hypothetical protein